MAQKKTAQAKKAALSASSKKASQKSAARKTGGQKATAHRPTAKHSAKKAAPPQKAAKAGAARKTAQQKLQVKPKLASKAQSGKAQSSKAPAKKSVTAAVSNRELGRRGHQKPEAPAPPPKPIKVSSRYGVGDKVVHPQHGAATIAKRVKREFGGEVRDYYVLDISTESLTVMVPIDKIDSVVRSVISKAQSRNVLNSLKEEAQEAGANWSRWYKVLTEKMYSGDIFQVAEVVRDLSFAQQTKGISPALKRMLSKARMTLISELSFSLEVDEEEATHRLDKAVPKIENPLAPAAV